MKRVVFPRDSGEDIGVGRKWLCGVLTGGLGSAFATPSDVVKIRMQVCACVGVCSGGYRIRLK